MSNHDPTQISGHCRLLTNADLYRFDTDILITF